MRLTFSGEVSVLEGGALSGKLVIAGRSVFFELLKRPSKALPVGVSKRGAELAIPVLGVVRVQWARPDAVRPSRDGAEPTAGAAALRHMGRVGHFDVS
jgi:hypothetical protein